MARLLSCLRRRGASESGMAMVLSMSVAFVVFTLGAVWIGLGTHQITATGREKLRDQARNVAEAGLNAAMSRLSADASATGIDLTAMAGGEFEVTILPVVDPAIDPADPRRYIISRGYAPTKANPSRMARRLEQQVEIVPTDGFRYALFSSPGGITGANHLTVNGDVYASGDLTLANNSTVMGSVTSLGSVTTNNNTSIRGDVHAADDVTLSSSTTVMGNVYAGGNVTIVGLGQVTGNVQAGGTILGGQVGGSRSQFSPPPPPTAQTLPTFTWDPANYPSGVSDWASPAQFQTYWSDNRSAFSGAHRITCAVTCGTVDFGAKWTLTGDTTIYTDGPISLSRDIANGNPLKDANGTPLPVTLTIVSDAADSGPTPAISMSDNVTVPDNINVVFFAPNGTVKFTQLKHFTGAVYAAAIALSQNFTITFRPVTIAGFDFGLTSSTHNTITASAFKEVSFS